MQRQRWQLLALYAVVLVALAWPVLWVEVPVGVDTLNHFARIHVRAHIGDDPDLARLFEVRNVFVPYLGMDWLLTPFANFIPTLALARAFTVALVWGIVGATAVLHRSFTGRWGWEPLLASLVAWNSLMAWGLLNYVLGMIFAMLGLAAWHAWRAWRRRWRLLVFTIIASVLLLTHLLSLLTYMLFVIIHILIINKKFRSVDMTLLAVSLVPALLIACQSSAPPSSGDIAIYSTGWKILALLSPVLFSGFSGGAETGYVVGPVVAVGALTMAGFGTAKTEALPQRIALISIIIAILLPTVLLGIFGVDLRLPTVAFCIAISGLTIRLHSFQAGAGILTVAACLLGLRIIDVSTTMSALQSTYAELRTSLAHVPRGSVLIPLINRTKYDGIAPPHMMYEHLTQMVTLERSGVATDFFSQLGAVRGRGAASSYKSPTLGEVILEELPAHGYALMIHLGQVWDLPPGAYRVTRGKMMDVLALP